MRHWLVRDLGCSLVQGYIFGKPMPDVEALELAKNTMAAEQASAKTQVTH